MNLEFCVVRSISSSNWNVFSFSKMGCKENFLQRSFQINSQLNYVKVKELCSISYYQHNICT